MIFQVFLLLCMGLFAGLVFGSLEGETTVHRRQTGGSKLNHPLLLIVRLVVCVVAVAFLFGWTEKTLWGAGLMFAVLTMVHRVEFNHSVGMAYWYMGPEERSDKDSLYDSAMHWLSDWFSFVIRKDPSPKGPFFAALVLETVGLLVAGRGFVGMGE